MPRERLHPIADYSLPGVSIMMETSWSSAKPACPALVEKPWFLLFLAWQRLFSFSSGAFNGD